MEVNYNGKIYVLDNNNSLSDKGLIDSSWFYVKNNDIVDNQEELEQLRELYINVKYLHNEYYDKDLINKIKTMERNIL